MSYRHRVVTVFSWAAVLAVALSALVTLLLAARGCAGCIDAPGGGHTAISGPVREHGRPGRGQHSAP